MLERIFPLRNGAADEARTRYLHLGKVALYQMSYGRIFGAFFPAPSHSYRNSRLSSKKRRSPSGAPSKACAARFCGEKEKVWCLPQSVPRSGAIKASVWTSDTATRIGLEPTTPSVTGWCSNQLSYRAKTEADASAPKWSGRRGSNSLPPPWQGGALPDELRPHKMVPPIGIEPMTRGFSVPCSTD